LPHAEKGGETNWFEAAEGSDPLVIADELGRPVAILRIGGRVPAAGGPDDAFLGGSPPVVRCRLPTDRRLPPLAGELAGKGTPRQWADSSAPRATLRGLKATQQFEASHP
jgi:hypothetical protein